MDGRREVKVKVVMKRSCGTIVRRVEEGDVMGLFGWRKACTATCCVRKDDGVMDGDGAVRANARDLNGMGGVVGVEGD